MKMGKTPCSGTFYNAFTMCVAQGFLGPPRSFSVKKRTSKTLLPPVLIVGDGRRDHRVVSSLVLCLQASLSERVGFQVCPAGPAVCSRASVRRRSLGLGNALQSTLLIRPRPDGEGVPPRPISCVCHSVSCREATGSTGHLAVH